MGAKDGNRSRALNHTHSSSKLLSLKARTLHTSMRIIMYMQILQMDMIINVITKLVCINYTTRPMPTENLYITELAQPIQKQNTVCIQNTSVNDH